MGAPVNPRPGDPRPASPRADALRTVEQQQAIVLAAVRERGIVEAETVAIDDAYGRTLAEPVRAAVPIPVFDNSAMDGFAVRFADVSDASATAPVTLRVVADLPAGSPADPAIGPGEAVRIMTGSAVPSDADVIVPFESTLGGLDDSLGEITVHTAPSAIGEHIRRRAVDAAPGDEVVPRGIRLGAFQVSAAAGAGVAHVAVARRPRVAIVSTGDELAEPGADLERGQIPESNGRLLAGLVADAGGEVVLRTVVDDAGPGLRAALERAHDADVVVFSGGVSAGAYEVVKNELDDAMEFAKVAMQPGKPQGFGVREGVLLFGLPGNPVSVAVSFEVFVRPAVLALQGARELTRPLVRLPAGAAWRTPPGRRQYLPAVIDRRDPARWSVAPATAGGSGSHLVGGLGRAEAFAIVPAEVEAVAPGDLVDVLLLP